MPSSLQNRHRFRQRRFDDRLVVIRKTELERTDKTIHLLRITGTDDGTGDGRVAQGPGDGHIGHGPSILVGNPPQHLDKIEALGEQRFLEGRVDLFAPVAIGKVVRSARGSSYR